MDVSIPTGPDQDISRIPDVPVSMEIKEKSDIAKFQEDAQRLFPPNVVVPFAQLAEQCINQGTPETMLQKLYDQGVIMCQIGPETANYFMEWMTEEQKNNQNESHGDCSDVSTNHRTKYHVLSLMKLHVPFKYPADLSKYLVNSRFHLAPYIEGFQHKYGNLDIGFPVTQKTIDEDSNSGEFRLGCITQENNGDAMFLDHLRHHAALKYCVKKIDTLEEENSQLRAELAAKGGNGVKNDVLADLGDMMGGLTTGFGTTRDKKRAERNFKVAKNRQKAVRQRNKSKCVQRAASGGSD